MKSYVTPIGAWSSPSFVRLNGIFLACENFTHNEAWFVNDSSRINHKASKDALSVCLDGCFKKPPPTADLRGNPQAIPRTVICRHCTPPFDRSPGQGAFHPGRTRLSPDAGTAVQARIGQRACARPDSGRDCGFTPAHYEVFTVERRDRTTRITRTYRAGTRTRLI